LKSDIEIASVHHRLPDRIRAHALICFLALALHRVMRMRLKAKGHHASPQLALDILSRIQKHTAYAGSRSFHGISKTTPEQLELFETLNPDYSPRCCFCCGAGYGRVSSSASLRRRVLVLDCDLRVSGIWVRRGLLPQ
jgi:hypothetical protein